MLTGLDEGVVPRDRPLHHVIGAVERPRFPRLADDVDPAAAAVLRVLDRGAAFLDLGPEPVGRKVCSSVVLVVGGCTW